MGSVSIVIITWNGMRHLQKCLASLASYSKRPGVEIILVDNGSHDGTDQWVRDAYPSVRFVALKENKGVAYARNRGLELAKGDFLLILDNDTVVTETALDGMTRYLEEHPEVGLCGCRLIDSNGIVQESCKKFPGIWEKTANLLYGSRYRYAYGKKRMAEPFEPEYLIGACQLIRRQAFEDAGFLDERIFIGPEDADFCLRVHAKGWGIRYLPQFTIMHSCQRLTNRHLFSKLGRKHVAALFYLYWKYKRLI